MAQHFKDYYAILGISFSASEAEIKSAYRKMARLFHPDMHPENAEGFTARFQEITEAYETLSDDQKKKGYDQQYSYNVLGKEPAFEPYYYEPQYEYEPYQPPVESKRKTYATYAAFLLIAFYFIKMISGLIPSSTDTKNYYKPLVMPASQQANFSGAPKDTLNAATPATEVKKPW